MTMSRINGYPPLTMSTDGAQEDFDFYTKALGLHSVKRTVLYDGVIPVYHLYYGSPKGAPPTTTQTFPFPNPGVVGRGGAARRRGGVGACPPPPPRAARRRGGGRFPGLRV